MQAATSCTIPLITLSSCSIKDTYLCFPLCSVNESSVCLNFNIHPRFISQLFNCSGKINTLARKYIVPCLFEIWLARPVCQELANSLKCVVLVNGWFKQPHLAQVKLIRLWGWVRLHTRLNNHAHRWNQPSPHTLGRSPPTLLRSETNWRYSKSLCYTDRAF